MTFYRVLLKKTQRFFKDKGKTVWEHTEITDLKKVVSYRQTNNHYKFSDFIILEYNLDGLTNKYYLYKGELMPTETCQDYLEGLYE